MRFLIPLGLFLLLAVFLYHGLFLNPRDLDSTLLDKPAPAFQLAKVKQPEQQFSSEDLKGQVTMLNVWASWCVSCRQEHPLFMELAQRQTVPIYGLNWKDQLPDAQAWLQQFGDPYLASAFDTTGRTGIDYGVTGTPETFIVDKQGRIRYKYTGPITWDAFEKKLFPLIEKLRAEQPLS
jgi:cytochrome c biogenesis protein CcmG/thiol:disulfide interchange protein DsbE